MAWNGKNRRRAIRVDFPYTIILTCPKKRPISTYTENISAVGVKVVIRERLDTSSMLGLEIYMRREHVICKGKVAWVKEREAVYVEETSFFHTGIEFCDLKEEDRQFIIERVKELKAQ